MSCQRSLRLKMGMHQASVLSPFRLAVAVDKAWKKESAGQLWYYKEWLV